MRGKCYLLSSLFVTVYLRASPEICFERIKKRARTEEACVPFVSTLLDLYELDSLL